MRDRQIIVNKKQVAVDEELEFIFGELMDIYNHRAYDAGVEWEDKFEEFVYTMATAIWRNVDNYRADLISNEPLHSEPWEDEE